MVELSRCTGAAETCPRFATEAGGTAGLVVPTLAFAFKAEWVVAFACCGFAAVAVCRFIGPATVLEMGLGVIEGSSAAALK